MRSSLLTILLLSFSSILFSQDFRPGYIVTQAGDTVRGQLMFRQNARLYRECEFRTPGNSKATIYTPEQLRAYRYDDDKLFLSINLTTVTNAQDDLPKNKVFADVLVGGALSLYSFDNFYLAQKPGEDLYQLYNSISRISNESVGTNTGTGYDYVQEKKEYIGLLKFLSQECEKISYNNVKFNKQSLYKAVVKYNECTGRAYDVYTEDKPWFQLTFNAEVGYQVSSLTLDEEYRRGEHLSQEFDPSATIIPAVFLDFSAPRFNEHFVFEAGIMYLGNTYRSTFGMDNGYTISDYDVNIDIKQLKIPLAIRYNLTGSKLQPFVLAGISTSFFLSSGSHYTVHKEYANGQTYDGQETDFVRLKSGQFGMHGAIGIVTRLGTGIGGYVKISYERNNGVLQTDPTDTDLARSSINNFQISAGIQL